jgi:ABC-type glycerol-3-phosphate transport system substrate-binding protein
LAGAAAGGRRAVLGTTDGWGLWKGTKGKDAAWGLMTFLTSREWYERQADVEGLLPSRKSVLDAWVKVTREKTPALATIDYTVVTDALTRLNYPVVDEAFLCQAEVSTQVMTAAQDAVFRDGEQPPTYFRDIKADIERAAASCGLRPAEVFR